MRGDLYHLMPDNEILAEAHRRGASDSIKKLKQRERFQPQGGGRKPIHEIVIEVEILNPLEACRQLAKILGMKGMEAPADKIKRNVDEALARIVEKAKAAGITLTEDMKKDAEAKLRKMYGG